MACCQECISLAAACLLWRYWWTKGSKAAFQCVWHNKPRPKNQLLLIALPVLTRICVRPNTNTLTRTHWYNAFSGAFNIILHLQFSNNNLQSAASVFVHIIAQVLMGWSVSGLKSPPGYKNMHILAHTQKGLKRHRQACDNDEEKSLS